MPAISTRLACGLAIAALAILGDAISIHGIHAGANPETRERPFRQEFSTFKNSGAAFDLYVQALLKLQQRDQQDPLSFFGVAGNLSGFGSTRAETPQEIVWYNAQQVAEAYPPARQAEYKAAAWSLRIPYWDWSISPTMPPEVSQPMIHINTPEGSREVQNPLYNYTFNPLPSEADFPAIGPPVQGRRLGAFLSTVRYPDSAGRSQPDLVNRQLRANGPSFHTLVYQLITQQPNYGPFSNQGYVDTRGGRYNSIENMHNGIHMFVGNGGHMSNIPYSSFDPIFWLHHANVDRLFALWQAVYPSSRMVPQVNAVGTLTTDPGTLEDINSPLTPFHSDENGTFWTSATAWSTRRFGYAYPEIIDWGVTRSQLASNVKSRLNALYNPTNRISTRSILSDTSTNMALSPNAMDAQWFANIRIDKEAASSPFFVHIFLDAAPTDPETWSFASNLVGSHSVVDSNILGPTESKDQIYGQIPLNHALLAAGESDLSPNQVVPLLTSRLTWRLQAVDDSPLDVGEVPSLKIHVVGQEVRQREADDEFPEYGRFQVYRAITSGKAGGLGDDDPLD
ncbi:MAG: hypothetical protein Q9174_003596, partial [Haloplaca sp. 1 TL-2023]